jgi:hypothetical protein
MLLSMREKRVLACLARVEVVRWGVTAVTSRLQFHHVAVL